MMKNLENLQWQQSGMVSVTVLEKLVSKLLVHTERDALRKGFVELVQEWHQPQKIALYSSGQRGFLAHRGQSQFEIGMFDLLDHLSTVQPISNNEFVYQAVISKETQTLLARPHGYVDLYVPLLQGDVVGAVLALEGVFFDPVNKLVWEQMLAAYNSLNQLLYSAEIDHLTGLMNRLAFERLLNQAAADNKRVATHDEATYFVLIDIDFFKRINDSFGHLYGDEVLILLARSMSESFRSIDWLFRYGGEEFAIVLHDVSFDEAASVLERFRNKIENTAFPQVGQVTVSIGYSRMEKFEAVSSLIDRADNALYYVKNNGRNQVMNYEVLVEQGLLKQAQQEVAEVELF